MDRPPPLPLDPDLGRYKVVRRLAVGGMAEVYLAREVGLEGFERTVVVKRIRAEHRDDDELITMFLDEARLLGALSHPNIAQVFDLGSSGGTYFLVMEYVRGPTLKSIMTAQRRTKGGGLPEREALAIALALAEALAYVHSRRDDLGRPLAIVHRDLNPSNVIISYDGAVKLIDFGIAKAATKVYETVTGEVKGTCGYMAPEQLRGAKGLDHRVDLFALGVMLFEMCLGSHPADVDVPAGPSAVTAPTDRKDQPHYDRMLEARYRSPREIRPDFPEALDRLIAACLAPSPQDRPKDVRTLIRALKARQLALGALASLGDLAALVESLVPDREGAPRLRPLTIIEQDPSA